jgi:thiamine biosynthesis protein ThiI
MTSIVIHYKELALKGKNRPWFVQVLVRNLRTALHGLDIASVRSAMGRIEIELGRTTSRRWPPASCRVSANGSCRRFG